MKGIATLALILGLSFPSIRVRAEGTLEAHLKYAAEHNPGVQEKLLEYRAARERSPQAASLPDPQLEAGVLPMPMQLPGGDLVAEIKVMQMFPWFGTLGAAREEATYMAQARYEKYRDAQNDLALQVKSTWFEAYKIKQEIAITEQSLQLLKTLERLALIKIQTGDAASSMAGNSSMTPSGTPSAKSKAASGMKMGGASKSDISGGTSADNMESGGSMAGAGANTSEMANVFRLRIEMLTLQNNIAALKDNFAALQFKFNSLVYREQSPLDLPDSLTPPPPGVKGNPDSTVFGSHPMVRMSQAEQSASSAKLRMVSRMGYPMLGIGLNYSIMTNNQPAGGSNGDDMFMPMVSVSLPIYRKKYRAMKKESHYLRQAAEKSEENAILSLKTGYDASFKRFQEAQRNYAMYASQASLARQGVKIMTTTFATGSGEFDALLRLQQDLLTYQIKQNQSLADQWIAASELEALTTNSHTVLGEKSHDTE